MLVRRVLLSSLNAMAEPSVSAYLSSSPCPLVASTLKGMKTGASLVVATLEIGVFRRICG